jgi:acyl carrier protein
MKDMILDYVKKEYLDEDEAEDMVLDENTPLISSGIVEKKFGITIPDEEASPQAFDTVSSILVLVNKQLAKKGV